jgi:hypothetical protein
LRSIILERQSSIATRANSAVGIQSGRIHMNPCPEIQSGRKVWQLLSPRAKGRRLPKATMVPPWTLIMSLGHQFVVRPP